MIKIISLLAGVALMLAAGSASALTFTSTKYLGDILSGQGTKTWSQAMPGDFQIPYDTVNSATLKISSNFVDGNNDKIFAESVYVGTLTNETWNWFGLTPEISTFNVASAITGPWATGAALDVTLNYNETGRINFLQLYCSELTLDYNNVSAPVPEPGTIVLLGAGLLGLGFYGRRRVQK